MIDLSTVKELRALRLPGMARELESQLEDPQRYKALSFEDRLALLVDAESVSRRKNTIQRRIHEARLSESQACVEAIEYHEDRELDKGLITKLATCAYIRDNHHVVLKGATGAGKSYIANALGVAACRQFYKVRYVRMPDLLNEYAVANDLLELIDACSQKGAMILCAQYDVDGWYYRIDCDRAEDEGSAIAEGILDRIINNKYSIEVKGRISTRKRHAFSDEGSGVNDNG